jgi:phosphoribosyl-ATP pyrophosphohydrolase
MSIYQDAINHFGVERQKMKAIEESSELTRAISRNDRENIIEEIADNRIMQEQLKIIYNIEESDIARVRIQKLNRLYNTIHNKE